MLPPSSSPSVVLHYRVISWRRVWPSQRSRRQWSPTRPSLRWCRAWTRWLLERTACWRTGGWGLRRGPTQSRWPPNTFRCPWSSSVRCTSSRRCTCARTSRTPSIRSGRRWTSFRSTRRQRPWPRDTVPFSTTCPPSWSRSSSRTSEYFAFINTCWSGLIKLRGLGGGGGGGNVCGYRVGQL